MRALITGSAGFIGSTIAKELASNGAEVVGLAKLSSGYRTNISGQTRRAREVRRLTLGPTQYRPCEVINSVE